MVKLGISARKAMSPISRVKVRFILHQPGLRSQEGVLYIRVTVDGQRAPEKSTGLRVLPSAWDSKKQTVIGKSFDSELLNTQLDQYRTRFREAESRLSMSGEALTAKKLVSFALGENTPRDYTLADVYNRVVREKELTTKNSKRTYEVYAKYFSNINRFLEEAGQKNILLNDINEDIFYNLIEWLKEQYREDYAKKNAQFFRTLYTYAHSWGYVDRNPLKLIRLEGAGEYDTTHLDQNEIKQLIEFDFSTVDLKPEHRRVLEEERDVLVFTCYTGLHHSDFVERGYQMTDYNGSKWIEGYRVKSKGGRKDKEYRMKLHPYALEIIERYNGIHSLPVRNNQKRNQILKEIAAYVGINKTLTTKIGRKSLANYCVNVLGLSFEVVAEILGHRSTDYIKHYAKFKKERLDKDIQFDLGDI